MGDGLAVLGFFIEKDSENDVSGLFICLFLWNFIFALADHDLDRIIKEDVNKNVQSMNANIHTQDKSLMNLFVNNVDTSQFFRWAVIPLIMSIIDK